MKILTAEQLKQLDRYTIEHEPIASIDLMERAATCLTEAIRRRWDTTHTFVVMAGPSGNGGDALAVARMLAQHGYATHTYLFDVKNNLSADCRENLERLKQTEGAELTHITQQFEPPELSNEAVVIDGLFGTGLKGPLRGGFAQLAKYINRLPARVVSIDLPSGMMAEDNSYNVEANIVKADVTLTVGLPKLAFLMADMAPLVGEVEVLDIGLSREEYNRMTTPYVLTEPTDVRSLLKVRPVFGHKGTFGHALLIAGRRGMAGAALLAARACLRSGVGKLTVGTPGANVEILQIGVPEAVLHIDVSHEHFSQPIEASAFQAMCIGPGLGTDAESATAFIAQAHAARVPLVVDADGLNILSSHKGWLNQLPAGSILTPHVGELARLVGTTGMSSYSALQAARELARRHRFYVVLKGHYTAICTPDGSVFFNATGNNGMATAGSGDVLSGMLLGLLAQGYGPLEACRLGVWLHGLAGDLAARQLGTHSLVAGDLVNYIPKAFLSLNENQ